MWPGKTGTYHGCGQFRFSKNIDGIDPIAFLIKLVNLLQFTGSLSVDFHGFMIQGGDPVFQFGSQNSSLVFEGLVLDDNRKFEENHILLDDIKMKTKFTEYLSRLTLADLNRLWFASHDALGLFSLSGYKMGRLVTMTVFYEPNVFSVDELLNPVD